MAGVSTKEIKNRIRSMESTRQITKAMEMVAASKLRRAQAQIASSRPYFEILYSTIQDILRTNREFQSPYLKERSGNRVMYIVIAGDRGLAGGYNSNILKLVQSEIQDKDATVLPIGKKAVEYFERRGVPMLTRAFAEAGEISVADCFEIARLVCKGFLAGEYDRIFLAYTRFVSMLSQTPVLTPVLPFAVPEGAEPAKNRDLILYEPSSEEVFDAIIPEYVAGMVYGGMCESVASEQSARRMAMDSATKNAGEMIENLNLYYNRARQAAITQEITEIVAGAEH